jgi:hypothetical protein
MNPLPIFLVVALSFIAPVVVRAETVLWDIRVDDGEEGQAVPVEPFVGQDCRAPQKVFTDEDSQLVVATAGGRKGFRFSKTTATAYRPMLILDAGDAEFTGRSTIRISWEVVIESWSDSSDTPAVTLLSQNILGSKGAEIARVSFVSLKGTEGGVVSLEGFPNGEKPRTISWKAGEPVRFEIVLDLGRTAVSVKVNGETIIDTAIDPDRFVTFRGFRIRDGAAVGGNRGETVTAFFRDLRVTMD